jgi:hypothetical protein
MISSAIVFACGPRRKRRGFALIASALTLLALCWPMAAEGSPRLPDGEITSVGGVTAYLIEPTRRYDHGVLGDAIEAGGFAVEIAGRRLTYRLGADAVFEDRRVRLADVDGDGAPEAILVKSYLDRGAAIAVFRIGAEGIAPLAESPPIGQRHRWLNPVGIADFTGNGEPMIAAVITPHLAGSLRIYRVSGASLLEVARIDGLTNHILGNRDLDLARVAEAEGGGVPRIVLPTIDRKSLAVVSFQGGRPALLRKAPVPGGITALVGLGRGTANVRTGEGTAIEIDLR